MVKYSVDDNIITMFLSFESHLNLILCLLLALNNNFKWIASLYHTNRHYDDCIIVWF